MSLDKRNKRIFFLTPYPPGTAPGQRFRFEQFLSILTAHGTTIKLLPFLSPGAKEILYTSGNYIKKIAGVFVGLIRRFSCLPQLCTADYVFIFREATPLGPPFFEWLIAKVLRKKIIYDFDDAIWLQNTSHENKIISWLKWPDKVKSICKWSYRVSCGNDYLADFARSFNSTVIVNPTTIDTEMLHNPNLYSIEKERHTITVGWTGTHSTLFYLDPLLPVFESLSKKYPQLRLIVIADRGPDWNLSCLKFIKWNKQTEIADLLRIDIGVMPLTDDPWANGKCGFKALQYMSLGKPALVSPVGVNKKIVDHGINGYHCSTVDEWLNRIEYLMNRSDVCKEMGRSGREKVINHYSRISNAPNFLSLFE